MAEFLPLCDVLFNVISLAGYFCDVVFDVVMGYALFERGYKGTFAAAMSIIVTSLVISQVLSLRWYLHLWSESDSDTRKGRPPWLPILLHFMQLGVLWRYAKLFVPVDLRYVKHEVRNLCMLRLVHAFCEAAPMLLLQLHILFEDPNVYTIHDVLNTVPELNIDEPKANKAFAELNVISASLSLFSVCWALASFSKNVRLQNVHRLVLTWLGVIFQFLWRLGTISARVCALTVYALVYEHWVFLVIGLHWVSMFLWLISPKNAFHGERISKPRKAYLSALIAFLYVFAYVNLQDLNHRQKMVTFYCVMFVENCLLVGAWAAGRNRVTHSPSLVAGFMLISFAGGITFMLIYYRYFHVRRLGYILGENQQGTNSTNASSQSKKGKQSSQGEAVIPGVFNCRFANPVINGANGRKKKKPTSFVPPPAAPAAAFWRRPLPHNHHQGGSSENEGSSIGSRVNIQQKLQEKKQKQLAELRVIEEEIKQGKLAKTTPAAADEIYSSLQRQPIPRAKTHAETPAWPSMELPNYQNYPLHNCNIYPTYTEIKNINQEDTRRHYDTNGMYYEIPVNMNEVLNNYLGTGNVLNSPRPTGNYDRKVKNNIYSEEYLEYTEENKFKSTDNSFGDLPYPVLPAVKSKLEQMRKIQRCRTPELLLAPHYLQGCSRPVCSHWSAPYSGRKREGCIGGSSGEESSTERPTHDTPRPPSDIDSQISLPRSYTLPREFRYWRKRPKRYEPHIRSNNSSDGDVDSGDDNSERHSNCSVASQIQNPTFGGYIHRTELDRVYNDDGPLYSSCLGERRPMRRLHGFRIQGTGKPETKL